MKYISFTSKDGSEMIVAAACVSRGKDGEVRIWKHGDADEEYWSIPAGVYADAVFRKARTDLP